MKKESFILALVVALAAVVIIASCKKDNTPMAVVQVKDAINNSPVNGAVVGIHRCGLFDPLCGLIAYRSGTTGNDGTCSFTQEDFGHAQTITVGKNGYWFTFEPKMNSVLFYPDGWLKIRVIRGTNYPPGSTLRIQTNYVPGNKSNGLQAPPPADSVIILRAYGGASNRIDWSVVSSSFAQLNSGSFSQDIPRQDTINFVLNY
jgi:hypothetical protein